MNVSSRPYLLPSRDFYSLGTGMPVWGVRPVHSGGEVVRLTLHSAYDNYEDAVRLYETVLGQRAEEQKAGFCWFTLPGPLELQDEYPYPLGVTLQLALKQLQPGVRVQPCSSAVLQFRAGEIGQLVPLLPNPCSPISATRWQTEDLDGNKILFQVRVPHRMLVLLCQCRAKLMTLLFTEKLKSPSVFLEFSFIGYRCWVIHINHCRNHTISVSSHSMSTTCCGILRNVFSLHHQNDVIFGQHVFIVTLLPNSHSILVLYL